jgi:hypothetical protein
MFWVTSQASNDWIVMNINQLAIRSYLDKPTTMKLKKNVLNVAFFANEKRIKSSVTGDNKIVSIPASHVGLLK